MVCDERLRSGRPDLPSVSVEDARQFRRSPDHWLPSREPDPQCASGRGRIRAFRRRGDSGRGAERILSSAGRFILPLCNFTRYLPVPALVPLCILWFGIDDAQKIAVITLGSVFQLLALIAGDTASIPQDLVEAARTLGLSEAAVLRRVVLWWALPAIWDDLRVCAGWAWSYLVLAELVAGNRGLGYFVIQSQRYLYTDRVFAGIVLIGLVGLLTDRMFKLAGPRLFPWV